MPCSHEEGAVGVIMGGGPGHCCAPGCGGSCTMPGGGPGALGAVRTTLKIDLVQPGEKGRASQ